MSEAALQRGDVTTVAAQRRFERFFTRHQRGEIWKLKITNTESAATWSSNRSSIMGNAGFGVCAPFKNLPLYPVIASCGNLLI